MSSRGQATRARASVATKPLSIKQRGERATSGLRRVLNLPAVDGDAAAFTTALAEIVSEETARNARFADAFRVRYHELMTQQPPTKQGGSKVELPALVPIRRIEGHRADPFSPPDPHFFTQLYGDHQLDRALQDYTLEMLKETAANVKAAHPGTKPISTAKKQAVIDYIVRYSTGA